ncbi:M-like protein Enn [Streptococcus pyogenes]|uniref:M-related protein Enn n=1 Tax=Streptococcus pyogenes TaxID=1314 RepID=UPI0010A11C37|nr:M-related protein Enn [Streptococcus pyogenes]VGV53954.1 M-like protein Enn [Streptococcus pyogenes]VGV56765.1 M-like protein Enn [Streptococcus pyogenes]
MTRQQTKKNYSLRKLKTGTASVAVALTVLGAGFANQTEVKADNKDNKLVSVKKTDEELHNEIAELLEKNGEYLDKIEELEAKEKSSEDVERHYLRELDKEYKEHQKEKQQQQQEQEERQKNQEQLERKYQREVEKRYQEQQQKQQQLEAENQKLTEANKVSEASRKGLSNDLEASRAAKKELEAKHQKLEADHQVSETSRKGLSRDLEASREANKKVTSELTQAKAQLSALEESKKLSEKEKAELQAKLDAQGKALKEQLAKQAEELAKLRAEKAAGSKTPATKPANKERSGRAAQTATRPIQNKGMRSQLPSTGEAANPFFTAAAATVMVSAGMLALKRKEEN